MKKIIICCISHFPTRQRSGYATASERWIRGLRIFTQYQKYREDHLNLRKLVEDGSNNHLTLTKVRANLKTSFFHFKKKIFTSTFMSKSLSKTYNLRGSLSRNLVIQIIKHIKYDLTTHFCIDFIQHFRKILLSSFYFAFGDFLTN